MAKRTKGMKRSYLNRWSARYINTGNEDVVRRGMQEQGYRARVQSIALGIALPETIGVNQPRAEALKLADRIAVEKSTFYVVLLQTRAQKLVMVCGMKGGEVYFIESHRCGIFRKSIEYTTRESALEKLKMKRITWVETKSTQTAPANP